MDPHNNRTSRKFLKRKAKTRSNHITSRLTYNPLHKGKFTNQLRSKLQSEERCPPIITIPPPSMVIGAININGLDIDSPWALGQIVSKYNLKV